MHANDLVGSRWIRACGLVLAVVIADASVGAERSSAKSESKPASEQQLEQLVAPIALYPDALVAQVLMASTYPLEIVEASRWVKKHSGLEGKSLEDALDTESWDPSVKSLTAFPQVLSMMSDKLDWTTQLGDAFLAQQKEVMGSVQALRQKAKAAGNVESNDQQTVTVSPESTGNQTQTIIIEPANPQVVYVPTYNPMVVYGPWLYPAYPPFYWYPPGYVATSSMISFGVGLAVGSAMWGHCNWGRADVNINVNRYNSFNRTRITNKTWNHDSSHRRGVAYGDRSLQKRFGGNQARDVKARESFRGRAEHGREKISAGAADRFKGKHPAVSMGEAGSRVRAGDRFDARASQERHAGRENARSKARGARRAGPAFEGMGSGREARRHANRGSASRSGMGRSAGMGRSGGRGGGGGIRRGGGRRR